MLNGNGISGFSVKDGSSSWANPFGNDYLRGPSGNSSRFYRRMGSVNFRPPPFSVEGKSQAIAAGTIGAAATVARLCTTSRVVGAMMVFSGGVNRGGVKICTAAMSTLSAILARGRMLQAAAMANFSAAMSRTAAVVVGAVMSTCSATILRGRTLVASTSAALAQVSRAAGKGISASAQSWSVAYVNNRARFATLAASTASLAASAARSARKIFSAS